MYTIDSNFVHTFAGSPLDRAQHLRKDDKALQVLKQARESRFLLFHRLNVATDNDNQLAWITPKELPATLGETVFLGLHNGSARFAASAEKPDLVGDINRFSDCRQAVAALSIEEGGIVSQARAMLDWHRRNPYCAVCGNPSDSGRGGQIRLCNHCNKHIFPRTDPVAIMLIQNDDQGDYCLLGKSQGRMAQSNFYSALAGFIDQGESLEEAVRREVMEEAGIRVSSVSYHSSQPWPFPSSLMIGCHGIAVNQDIAIDTEEMADVAWFDRAQVLAAISGENTDLRIPGPGAIAHHLIKAWATA